MGLVASSSELSLFDLLQLKGLTRARCRISVSGREHEGTLYLEDGYVVHAAHGELCGEAAAHAILAEPTVEYRATSKVVVVPPPNMRATPVALALEGARRADEAGRQVVPISAARAARPAPTRSFRSAPPEAAPAAPARQRPVALAAVVAAAVVAAGGAGVLVASYRGRPVRSTAAGAAGRASGSAPEVPPAAWSAPLDAIEASALHPPSDSLPVLVQGSPPSAPDPAAALMPSVICRLLVGADGAVIKAELYQRRPDFAPFEAAALQAVRGYRFEPARRSGAATAVWINWPVEFH
jgi:TonB family protein